ncbi:MAG: LacI family DNA-binding transcriptional regulator, partial [Actinomycetes bacterium]
MDRARVTLTDVAQAAGVSPSTASRVLNGGAPVAPDLATRVYEAAERLGYRVNTQARSLRTGRDTTIGLVVEDFDIMLFARMASAVAALAAERGVHVVIATFGTGGSEPQAVQALASRNVAGMIVVEGQAGTGYLESIGRVQPVVLVDAARPHPTIDTVLVDNHGGGRRATECLIRREHSRIAFVGSSPRAKTVRRRYEGYV